MKLSTSIIIRAAKASDAAAIAAVHIQSWLETYPGIMPKKRLDALNLESCTRNWESAIHRCDIILVAELEDRIVGFVAGGKNRTQ
ncbi:MAG: hypothetical protein U1C33_03580, partial [Candidatus Cloacimonadaceae bacterium]|nr:hypothetical protein [Candidatus Cloacimonadaceae bacterium]